MRPPPEQTLARIRKLAPRAGVTRLAVLTGLDTIGIPVAAAVRPNSRTVAVHQGKGASLAQAKLSALMEAIECFCAETQMLKLRLGTTAEMRALGHALEVGVLDVGALPRRRGGPDPASARLLWMEGRAVASGAPVWVPRELVAADFSVPAPPDSGVFQATTNGLGSGNTEEEAILHGLCETIERDALTLWNALPEARRAATRVDPRAVAGALAAPLLDRCAAAGVRVAVADVTSDIAVPVMAAVLSDRAGAIQPELGSACHPDRDAALAGAIAEAAQARLTVISGARDDMEPEAYAPELAAARQRAAETWFATPKARADASLAATLPVTDAGRAIALVLDRLAARGLHDAALVDLTDSGLGVPVVRVVVPGLEGPDEGGAGEYAPGARMRRLRAALRG